MDTDNLPPPVTDSSEKDVIILREMLGIGDDYVSGSRLAELLGISRVAVWSYMEKMRSQGFDFEAIRSKGYRLTRQPSLLNEALVKASLPRSANGLRIIVLEETDSTNSEAERLLAMSEDAPFAVFSHKQTEGRGRLGRSWHSPPNGNLYMSFGFRPNVSPSRLASFTLWMGINLCECINAFCQVASKLKWPNDLQIEGKKVAGILTEARMDADQTRELVLGVGLNVNGKAEDWPEALKESATSIFQETDQQTNLNRLCAALCGRITLAYEQFLEDKHRSELINRWPQYDSLKDQSVSLLQGEARISGIARGIDSQGALIVEGEDGSKFHVRAGEVTLEK